MLIFTRKIKIVHFSERYLFKCKLVSTETSIFQHIRAMKDITLYIQLRINYSTQGTPLQTTPSSQFIINKRKIARFVRVFRN